MNKTLESLLQHPHILTSLTIDLLTLKSTIDEMNIQITAPTTSMVDLLTLMFFHHIYE